MKRKRSYVFLALLAVVVASCGRQVTPDPPYAGPGGLLPGYMSVKFDVAAPLTFGSVGYWVVFNTSGNGLTPLTNPTQNAFAAYSYAIEVNGANGGAYAQVWEYLHLSCCPGQPALAPVGTTPSQLQFIPNSNGQNTEFTVTFQPIVFKGLPIGPSPTPTPKPGASPTPTPPPVKSVWLFNAFTAQPNANSVLTFLDSLGTFGPTDTTFQSPQLNVATPFDRVIYANAGSSQITPQSAQIVSVEIANNPATPSPSPAPTASAAARFTSSSSGARDFRTPHPLRR